MLILGTAYFLVLSVWVDSSGMELEPGFAVRAQGLRL